MVGGEKILGSVQRDHGMKHFAREVSDPIAIGERKIRDRTTFRFFNQGPPPSAPSSQSRPCQRSFLFNDRMRATLPSFGVLDNFLGQS